MWVVTEHFNYTQSHNHMRGIGKGDTNREQPDVPGPRDAVTGSPVKTPLLQGVLEAGSGFWLKRSGRKYKEVALGFVAPTPFYSK